jgi:RHS repeat-associated protein
MFSARRLDEETDLYYFRSRSYDPECGRFLQRDALRSVNLYEYGRSTPTILVDPDGRSPTVSPIAGTAGDYGPESALSAEDLSASGWVPCGYEATGDRETFVPVKRIGETYSDDGEPVWEYAGGGIEELRQYYNVYGLWWGYWECEARILWKLEDPDSHMAYSKAIVDNNRKWALACGFVGVGVGGGQLASGAAKGVKALQAGKAIVTSAKAALGSTGIGLAAMAIGTGVSMLFSSRADAVSDWRADARDRGYTWTNGKVYKEDTVFIWEKRDYWVLQSRSTQRKLDPWVDLLPPTMRRWLNPRLGPPDEDDDPDDNKYPPGTITRPPSGGPATLDPPKPPR